MDRGQQRDADAKELGRLGYAQELLREMGGFGNFALSFSVISVLTGAVTLYGHGLRFGGPLEMSVGWLLVTLMTLTVAMSLAQLASSFPTAGALYHWAAICGGPGWGFATAWLNTVGQFAITAGVDYGLAEFVVPMLGLPSGRNTVLGVYALILTSHALLNHFGVRAVSILNWLSAFYHLVGVALLVAVICAFAPTRPLGFLATRFTSEPHAYYYGFLVGLLQAQWTLTGYDASAHITEETVDPTRNAPWGIFLSVAVSGVVGFALVAAVTLSIRDLPAAAAAPNPFIYVLDTALGSRIATPLVWMVLGAMWFCGLSSITSCSRMLFAFARDGGLPASKEIASVSKSFQSPHVAIWVSAVASFTVALWADAYSAIVALSTIALYASYALPIFVGLLAREDGRWRRRGPWDLGRWSLPVNLVALTWVAIVTVLFVLPPDLLAGYTFAGCIVLLTIYWFVWMRGRFTGPRVALDGPPSSLGSPVPSLKASREIEKV